MDAIVIAGGIPKPDEPLYEYTQGEPKALLDIAGKPMIKWVLDALDGSENIERVVIIGLPDNTIACAKLGASIPSQGDLLENVRAGVVKLLEINPEAHHVVVASSHRVEGFASLREAVEMYKKEIAVWKREDFDDGTSEWVH